MELKARRMKKGESLEALYTDVRRLVALTFPTMEYTERERDACEYFIDALAEPDCVLRVRQQNPKTLDAALRAAQNLEIWVQQSENLRNEDRRFKEVNDRRVREVTKTEQPSPKSEPLAKAHEVLKKEMAEYKKQTEEYKKQVEKQMADIQAAMTKFSFGNPSPSLDAEGPTEDTLHRTFACFGCRSPEHPLKDCPRKTAEEKKQFWNQYGKPLMSRRTRLLNEKKAHACLWVKFKKRRISALLDTRSDITVVGADLVKKMR